LVIADPGLGGSHEDHNAGRAAAEQGYCGPNWTGAESLSWAFPGVTQTLSTTPGTALHWSVVSAAIAAGAAMMAAAAPAATTSGVM
jgi:hypothetical protein